MLTFSFMIPSLTSFLLFVCDTTVCSDQTKMIISVIDASEDLIITYLPFLWAYFLVDRVLKL